MNYERTILEMLERIKILEEKVNVIEDYGHYAMAYDIFELKDGTLIMVRS